MNISPLYGRVWLAACHFYSERLVPMARGLHESRPLLTVWTAPSYGTPEANCMRGIRATESQRSSIMSWRGFKPASSGIFDC